ncbi:MAG: hypothetical protein VX529_08445 [Pseudomonadota bacterium]|jgi:hypothetical protein|nr:hypothetical protein [Pseudomonadota bacterium]
MEDWVGLWLSERAPELLMGGVFAASGAIMTSLYKGFFVKQRVRQRIGSEIVSVQRRLYERANPIDGWRGNDQRNDWMLEPFVQHIDLLKHLADQERLSARVKTALEDYRDKADVFVKAWAQARARHRGNFWVHYDASLEAGREVLRRLGELRAHRSDIDALARTERPVDEEVGP